MNPRRGEMDEPHHVAYKLPSGDSPYVRAKHVQMVEKDPEMAIALFWEAINAGDRVDSALKDLAVVMKQQDRAEEAIEAVKTCRDRCSRHAQESLDNVLIDLYKKCGRLEEQIELLKQKLGMIYQGEAFRGKPTKTARSHGRKFRVTVKQETSRILGNLGWAYMQQTNYEAAEIVYRKAQLMEPDANKACNLALCFIKQRKYEEAQHVLLDVVRGNLPGCEHPRSRSRAEELLSDMEPRGGGGSEPFSLPSFGISLEDAFVEGLDKMMSHLASNRSKRLPIFEEISPLRDQLAC
uniref:Protein SULFUR DEFICIENCY-INDUCED 1 n=2 Tax=Kalanchoe fedtschenkoi TaxID=63787 RepID=A0A7N1A561_KALFE